MNIKITVVPDNRNGSATSVRISAVVNMNEIIRRRIERAPNTPIARRMNTICARTYRAMPGRMFYPTIAVRSLPSCDLPGFFQRDDVHGCSGTKQRINIVLDACVREYSA